MDNIKELIQQELEIMQTNLKVGVTPSAAWVMEVFKKAITGIDQLQADKEQLSEEIGRLKKALQLAYKKHHLGNSDVGWGELGDILCDTLCESMGDREFQKWVDSQTSP